MTHLQYRGPIDRHTIDNRVSPALTNADRESLINLCLICFDKKLKSSNKKKNFFYPPLLAKFSKKVRETSPKKSLALQISTEVGGILTKYIYFDWKFNYLSFDYHMMWFTTF